MYSWHKISNWRIVMSAIFKLKTVYERKYSSCQQSVKIASVRKDFVLSMNVQTLIKKSNHHKKTENNWKKHLFNEHTAYWYSELYFKSLFFTENYSCRDKCNKYNNNIWIDTISSKVKVIQMIPKFATVVKRFWIQVIVVNVFETMVVSI